MEHYVGLDVSLKLTAICIVDRTGKIEREGVVASDPETIAAFIRSHAPHVARVGLETGATSTWLWTELNKMGLPVICIDARHAKAALKLQINKSDRNDAVGIARIMQCGWYKEVRVKDFDSHAIQITGRPSCLSSVHSHVAVGPVSRPIRTAAGAFDLTNAAIASGSESTTPSRTTDPTRFTTQIDVCFNDTSSPT
jgi:Transposase